MRNLLISLLGFAVVIGVWAYFDIVNPEALSGPTAYARLVLQSLMWVSGAFTIITATNLFFWDYFVSNIAKRPIPPLIKSASAFVIMLIALMGIVGMVLGLDVTGIWATSSLVGVVLGFALRTTLTDVFSGIAMNLDGSLKAGDWIELRSNSLTGRYYGKVLDIAWRATHIQLENNNIIIVPNSVMGVTVVTNYAHADHTSRFETELILDFDVPADRARRILLAGVYAAAANKHILTTPPPEVLVGEPQERGVTYRVRYWGKVTERSPTRMQDAVMTELLKHLHVAGLTPAFPKEDLYISRRPKRLLDHGSVEDRAEVLARVELFGQSMTTNELTQLAARVVPSTYAAGASLVRQGDPGNSLFVVVEGFLDVSVQRPGSEESLLLNHIVAGQIFGEMSLLTQAPRSATVVAATDVSVYEVTHSHFDEILSARPAIADQVSLLIARHQVRTNAALKEAPYFEVERETRRLKDEILDRMAAVFRGLLGKPARSRSAS